MTLTEFLTEKTVRARVKLRSWEEAVECVGRLLVNAGVVEERYIDAMKRVIYEFGPYAVIAPGIVLLHARPEDGVLKPCLGLITLATPVKFGHKENDPVDIVFALGAVDKKAHISALAVLAEMLMDQGVVSQLCAASDDQALLDVIRSWNSN